jgi:hypothetical protein
MFTQEWKWSNGEKNLKSVRPKVNLTNTTNTTNTSTNIEPNQNAIILSLNDYENENENKNYDTFMFEPLFSRNDNEMGKIREDLDNKISNRELIFQRGTNPFLQSSNYINDVVASDAFLKPKNTTFDKIKQSEEQ